MVELYGRQLSRRDISERSGALTQFAGVRLMTLGDGVERGIRLLEFRTGSGLRFTVLVDRAMDIADFDYKGRPSAGIRRPVFAILASTSMRERTDSAGPGPSPVFSSLAASITRCT